MWWLFWISRFVSFKLSWSTFWYGMRTLITKWSSFRLCFGVGIGWRGRVDIMWGGTSGRSWIVFSVMSLSRFGMELLLVNILKKTVCLRCGMCTRCRGLYPLYFMTDSQPKLCKYSPIWALLYLVYLLRSFPYSLLTLFILFDLVKSQTKFINFLVWFPFINLYHSY